MCECKKLKKLLATNWSYYQCIQCGAEFFSPGDAEIVWKWYDTKGQPEPLVKRKEK